MNVKSFHLYGLRFDIYAEKLPYDLIRLTVYVDGEAKKEPCCIVPEEDLDEAVEEIEQSIRKKLEL